MPRGKPVVLSNGRNWSKKGDAKDHFKKMLHRYGPGDRVTTQADHDDLLALVTDYDGVDPVWAGAKTGSGVAHFVKDFDDDPARARFESQCFFVIRTDGSRAHFSTNKAIDAIS